MRGLAEEEEGEPALLPLELLGQTQVGFGGRGEMRVKHRTTMLRSGMLWHAMARVPEKRGRRMLQAERPQSLALCLCVISSSYFSHLADGHRDQSCRWGKPCKPHYLLWPSSYSMALLPAAPSFPDCSNHAGTTSEETFILQLMAL